MTDIRNAPAGARLDIVSDVVCPWCYIGKRRLEQALELLDEPLDLDIRWQPFELNPTMPSTGMDRQAYCEAKFGSVEYANRLYAKVAANAHADGLPMDVQRIRTMPNTRRAHRLIEHAGEAGCQDAVVDALFAAFFVEGRDIGQLDTLLDIGAGAGMDRAALEHALDDHDSDANIEAGEERAHELGVTGVPSFLFNDRLLFTGAQSPQTIALAIQRALRRGL